MDSQKLMSTYWWQGFGRLALPSPSNNRRLRSVARSAGVDPIRVAKGFGGQPSELPELANRTAVFSVLAGMVLVVLDASLLQAAWPTLGRALDVSPARALWLVTAYQVALLMALLPCAALGERVGTRKVFTGGVALFTAASALCGVVPSWSGLVVARFLQGFGGAAVLALGIAVLREVVPSQRLGVAIGWNASAVALASAAGPSLGAAILAAGDWPWLFAAHLPLGLLVMLMARAQPNTRGRQAPLDWVSVGLNAGAVALWMMGVGLLPTRPGLGALVLIAALLDSVALIRREAPKRAPFVPLDLLRVKPFRIAVIASVACFAGQTAGMVALPYHLQHGLGQGMVEAGLTLTLWPLAVAVMAPFTGRVADRVSPAWLCLLGGAGIAVGLGGIAWGGDRRGRVLLAACTLLGGVGFSLFNVSNNRRIFLSAPRERSGAAGGLQSVARLIGQTAGAVLMTMLFTLTSPNAAPRIGLAVGALLTLVAGLVSGAELLKGSTGGKRFVSRSGSVSP